jgi:acetyltransferase EpsM
MAISLTRPTGVIVIGGGEHARVVIEAAQSRPQTWKVIGFVDQSPCPETTRRLGAKWLGTDEECGRYLVENEIVLGIGGVEAWKLRRALAQRYDKAKARWATIVHADACVSPTARLGAGVLVLAGAKVNTGAVLEDHSLINTGAIVEHDVLLGAFSQVAPGSVIGGGATIGEDCYLSLGCIIRDHIRVAGGVTVGMGAAVVNDIEEPGVIVGVPARPLAMVRQTSVRGGDIP